jgi:hypothetical protein
VPKHTRKSATKQTPDVGSKPASKPRQVNAIGFVDTVDTMRLARKIAKRLKLKRRDRDRMLRICALLCTHLESWNEA